MEAEYEAQVAQDALKVRTRLNSCAVACLIQVRGDHLAAGKEKVRRHGQSRSRQISLKRWLVKERMSRS